MLGAGLDLVVLLDEGAARAPVGRAAVGGAVARDAEPLADLGPLHHNVDPSATREALDGGKHQAVRVHGVGALHGGVAHAVGGLAEKDAGQESAETARVAGGAVHQAVVPLGLVADGSAADDAALHGRLGLVLALRGDGSGLLMLLLRRILLRLLRGVLLLVLLGRVGLGVLLGRRAAVLGDGLGLLRRVGLGVMLRRRAAVLRLALGRVGRRLAGRRRAVLRRRGLVVHRAVFVRWW